MSYESMVTAKMYQPTTHEKWLTEKEIPFSVIGQNYYFHSKEDALIFQLAWG